MAGKPRNDYSCLIEEAIINNQPDLLAHVLLKADVNTCLNNRRDSPLFLAVKLSHTSIVRTLLLSPGCDLAHQNINYYSPIDLSLVMVYDNQKEPRQSACWNILEMLLEAGAEPACPDAMLYVIRTALKLNDDQFILRLICTLIDYSKSFELHSLLLCKLHRNQPLYSGEFFDEFLERGSEYTVKLIKSCSSKENLHHIVACFPFYVDSHWESRHRRNSLFIKLVVYLSVVGWKWTDQADFDCIAKVSPGLAQWCYRVTRTPVSLRHACRISLTSSSYARQFILPSKIPNMLLSYINYADVDSLLPLKSDFNFDSLKM